MKTLDLMKNRVSFLASRWAAKEALVKAANNVELIFPLIEVSRQNGRPELVLHGRNLEQLRGVSEAHLSISHEDDYSIAFVILTSI